ncbi:ribbon-helix-helix protein, CopG family [Collimonas pratensis]|uniref:ribbon-helix-helix protein, CopG family n=1 Tax=Collimonas pratensis TaxID=279113 RepID=UPI00143E01A8|nr:ribbon-helix-helix protein, CopG family [Collimonas pratensis]NKI70648.1 ribbon-helix-helix protein, CopG family [Collimonas pratensis]
MRTLVDIPDGLIKGLADISATEKKSRAELIREAIAEYLQKHKPTTVAAFGLWKDRKVDGLAYQEQVRSEW